MEKTLKRARTEPRPKQGNGHDMTVLLRDIPPTYDWGWFSREDHRMHVQTVDKEHHRLHYKVWLENRGQRVIEPEPGIPAKVLKPLRAAIVRERQRLELYWA